jgi:hypothetical protein
MNNTKPAETASAQKKPYTAPTLAKHGDVESLTQQLATGPSHPTG